MPLASTGERIHGDPPESRLRFSIKADSLPKGFSEADRFQMAADAGFAGLEVRARSEPARIESVGDAARRAGLCIHSVHTATHWTHPLSSGDPSQVSRSIEATLTALENARAWGAESVQLIPGLVTTETSYAQAYQRSQRAIRSRIMRAGHAAVRALGRLSGTASTARTRRRSRLERQLAERSLREAAERCQRFLALRDRQEA